ncbi:MAG: leucine-rich repeat domain-containing protein [Promethearchaeota archaeon]
MFSPNKIFEKFCQNELDKTSTIELLLSIIENSSADHLRLESIDILNKIGVNGDTVFRVIENLMISDLNPELRISSLNLLFTNYQEKVLNPIKWMINYETSFKVLIIIIKTLAKIESDNSKNLLLTELKKIGSVKYLNLERNYKNKKYKKLVKKLLKSNKIEKFSHKQISEIIVNFLIVKHLSEKFPNVFFELNPQTLLVESLDLSDYLEYEVKGTPWGWRNNISNLSEIEGLENLEALYTLDLSNNQIRCIKDLNRLKSLTHLNLSNNKIKDPDNLSYLNDLPNLEYLNLCDNEVSNFLTPSSLNPKIRIISKRQLEEIEAKLQAKLE